MGCDNVNELPALCKHVGILNKKCSLLGEMNLSSDHNHSLSEFKTNSLI